MMDPLMTSQNKANLNKLVISGFVDDGRVSFASFNSSVLQDNQC